MSASGNAKPVAATMAQGASATAWPSFSIRELNRLRFLAFCRQTGRIRPAPTVRPEMEELCASLLADLRPSDGEPTPGRAGIGDAHSAGRAHSTHTPRQLVAARGVPATWAHWAALHGVLRPDRAGHHLPQSHG